MAEPERPSDEPTPDQRTADQRTAEQSETRPYAAQDAVATADRPHDVRQHDDRTEAVPAVPPAPADTAVAPPAEPVPAPPKRHSNRLVGTMWVLLAAGLFQVVFYAANALVALVFGGPDSVTSQLQSISEPVIAGTPIPYLPIVPVVLFFLLFELVVLVTNRAGRIVHVLASLIVGAVVYVLNVLLFSILVRGSLGDTNTLAGTFLNWEFILIGLVAREVMLWTGLAIGARGKRVRVRDKRAKQAYEHQLQARSDDR